MNKQNHHTAKTARINIMKITDYHPFKSPKAKEKYLKYYDAKSKKWPVPSETKTINTTHGQTNVRISGSPDALPLVLLHGGGGNLLQWMPNIKSLSKSFRTYAIDNIYDNGRSIYTKKIKDSDDFVMWLDELFTELGLESDINLIGLSYGGWIASQYSLKYPERLNRLVMIAPVFTILPLSFSWIIKAILCLIPDRYFTKKFMYWLLDDFSKNDENRNMLEELIDESYLAIRSVKTKSLPNPTVLSDSELQNIKVPALYIVGENEKIYSAEKAIHRLNSVAPQIKTVLLSNSGHDLTLVHTETVNKLIIDFCNQ